MGEYLWLWICAILSVVLYVPLYFCLRGNIRVDPSKWTHITFHCNTTSVDEYILRGTSTQKEAIKMLGYPLAYAVVVLPMSVGRWLLYANVETIENGTAGPAAKKYSMLILAGACVFGLSGAVNVVLFLFTRPKLLGLNQESRPNSLFPTVITIRQSHVTRLDTDEQSSEGLKVARDMYLEEAGRTHAASPDEAEWYELSKNDPGLP
jgi:hypothetical protein